MNGPSAFSTSHHEALRRHPVCGLLAAADSFGFPHPSPSKHTLRRHNQTGYRHHHP
jgi:hypothetical protein